MLASQVSKISIGLCLWVVLASCASLVPAPSFALGPETPQRLDTGWHLFLDDGYYTEFDTSSVVLGRPYKLPDNPLVLTASANPCQSVTQPFLTVQKNGSTYRMWYNTVDNSEPTRYGDNLYYIESSDPLEWGCAEKTDVPHSVTASITQGPHGYVLANNIILKPGNYEPGEDHLLTRVSTSNDGINWMQITEYGNGTDTIFPGRGTSGQSNWGDILNIYWDEWDQHYVLFFRYYEPYSWTDKEGVTHSNETIRRVGRTTSTDLVTWSDAEVLFSPDEQDSGITQFYGGPSGVRHVGTDLQIGLEKVLRDDIIRPDVPDGAYGYGYTVLAWRRPGEDWQRMREPWLDVSDVVDTWDYAHAWADTQVDASDTHTYVYYGGYRWGHKMGDRQIGAVLFGKNRYVARKDGVFVTKPVVYQADRMYLNVDAQAEGRQGEVVISVLAPDGATLMKCTPNTEDAVRVQVECPQPLSQYSDQPVKFQFELDQAYLFGFELSRDATVTPTSSPTPTPTPVTTPTATPLPTATPTPQTELRLWLPLLRH